MNIQLGYSRKIIWAAEYFSRQMNWGFLRPPNGVWDDRPWSFRYLSILHPQIVLKQTCFNANDYFLQGILDYFIHATYNDDEHIDIRLFWAHKIDVPKIGIPPSKFT